VLIHIKYMKLKTYFLHFFLHFLIEEKRGSRRLFTQLINWKLYFRIFLMSYKRIVWTLDKEAQNICFSPMMVLSLTFSQFSPSGRNYDRKISLNPLHFSPWAHCRLCFPAFPMVSEALILNCRRNVGRSEICQSQDWPKPS
jgi:hypothetical protein